MGSWHDASNEVVPDAYDRLLSSINETERLVNDLDVNDPEWDDKFDFINTRLTQIQDQLDAHKRDSVK